MREPIEFTEGAMWENYPWAIEFEHQCSEWGGGTPCRHCGPSSTVTHKRLDSSEFYEQVWICARVVIAKNEGGCATTGVCLDCILEAAQKIEGK